MDRHLFDIMWEVYRDVDGKQPIRSFPRIVLRHQRHVAPPLLGVARHSASTCWGMRSTFIPGVSLSQIRVSRGSACSAAASASIRHPVRRSCISTPAACGTGRACLTINWGVFPDGRTVHVPTDGVPLKDYELANADIEKRGSGDDAGSVAKPSFLAAPVQGQVERRGRRSRAWSEKPTPAVMAAPPRPPRRRRCRAPSRSSRLRCRARFGRYADRAALEAKPATAETR